MKILARLLCVLLAAWLCTGVALALAGIVKTNHGTTANDASHATTTAPATMYVTGICVINQGSTNVLKFKINGGDEIDAPTSYRGYCYDLAAKTVDTWTGVGTQTAWEIQWIGSTK